MNREEYLNNPDVSRFVAWAANTLPNLTVNLNISRAGTGRADGNHGPGVHGTFTGLNNIVQAYHWRASWEKQGGQEILSNDWASTRNSLSLLSEGIRNAVAAGSQDDSLEAATAIVEWGGDRNPNVGAIPFLRGIRNGVCLPSLRSGVTKKP